MVYQYQQGITKDKKNKFLIAVVSVVSAAILSIALIMRPTFAAPGDTVVVTPSNTQGWSTADTRPGGAVTFVVDPTAPGNPKVGALRLTTDETPAAKAQYMHAAETSINGVTELSYATKQVSGPVHAAPSYQLAIDTNGTATGGFTTLVYEPYQNGVVTPGVWQTWDVAAGQFWSSRSITCSNGTLVAGGGGAPFYTLSQIKTLCPEAVVVAFGVNIGSNNPSYNVEADLVNFNGTTYNFEPYQVASDKDQCKNGGWQNLTDSNGKPFKNQGQCVSSTVPAERD